MAVGLGIVMLLATACNDKYAYEYSVDVNSSEWTPADTLFYPIHVSIRPTSFSPIECHYPYCMALAVRYDGSFPAPIVPIRVMLDREYMVSLDLGDDMSVPDGDSWGSLVVKEFDITRAIFSFPDSGDYVLKIWPEDTVKTVSSVTVTLE